MKRTLLIATDSFLPRWDGVARFLYEVVPFLSKRFDIVIVAPKFPGKLDAFKEATIIRFPVYKRKIADINIAKVKRSVLIKLVKNSDIVWTHSIGPIGALAMYYAKKQKKPLISFVHSVEWFLFSKSLKRFRQSVEFTIRKIIPYLYNKCDVIMVPYGGMVPILAEQGIDVKKESVYLGMNTDRFHPPKSKKEAKNAVDLRDDKIIIGYLGRFGREKDIPTLYHAFRRVHEENPNTTLLLVGGSLKEPFPDMDSVRVISSTNNPVAYYQAMDIYVLPSLTETTSLTTMEAMSCGLPVVVTPVGYIPDYVEHKFNGYLFPCGSSERLALTLNILIKDAKLRKRMGATARETIKQRHSWKKTADSILDILDRF
ncbi:glycosyltransferase family 4 protein [Candidatus Woesearchaeota archaeon]|nr:glycosyltransferase family 4 protein [Candidatus Woesearchaeota archaeon]